MAKIISIHSFRRGTGKTAILTNIAVLLADSGLRVGLVDADLQSPSAHILLGVNEDGVENFLNDYLDERCAIEEAAIDLGKKSGHLNTGRKPIRGALYLVPSNPAPLIVAHIVRESIDVDQLARGLGNLAAALALDVVLVDAHGGLSEQNLSILAVSDAVLLVFRLTQQDFQGTSVFMGLAEQLDIDEVFLIANQVPANVTVSQAKATATETFGHEIAGALPYTDDLMALGSRGVFTDEYPEHPLSRAIQTLARDLYKQSL